MEQKIQQLRILSFTKAEQPKLYTEPWKKWPGNKQLNRHRNSKVFQANFGSIQGIVTVSVYTRMSEGLISRPVNNAGFTD